MPVRRKGDFSRAAIRMRCMRCPGYIEAGTHSQVPASESECLLSDTLSTSCVLPNQGPKFQNLYMGEFRVYYCNTRLNLDNPALGDGELKGDLN